MAERKQAVSTTVDKLTLRLLTQIAARDTNMNRSEAFRMCVREAAAARGLVPAPKTGQGVHNGGA